jgi:predicted RNA-binding protein with PUA-like domain
MPQAPQLNLKSGNAAEFQQLFAEYHAAKANPQSPEFKRVDIALRRKIAALTMDDLQVNEVHFAPIFERAA